MVHNPGGDWHPGQGDNPNYDDDDFFLASPLKINGWNIIMEVWFRSFSGF